MNKTLPCFVIISISLLVIVITNRLTVFLIVDHWNAGYTEVKWALYMAITSLVCAVACWNSRFCNAASVISCPLVTQIMAKSFSVFALGYHIHLSLESYANAALGLLLAGLYFVLYGQVSGKCKEVFLVGVLLSVGIFPMAYQHTLGMLNAP